jgi:hypothetical protein
LPPAHTGSLFRQVSVDCSSARKNARSAVGRIDDHRRAQAGVLDGEERRVVGAADVERGSALLTRVVAVVGRALPVQFLPLRFGEEFLVAVPDRPLQRRVELLRPDPLKIRLAPGRFQRRAGRRLRWSLSRSPGGRRRYGDAGGGCNRDSDERG